MIYKYAFQIMGIIDTINDWNEKLNKIASKYMDNVGFGTIAVVGIFAIGCWGVATLNKK